MNYLVPANEHERAAPPAEPCHADAVNARNAYFSSFSPPFFPFLLPRSRLRRRPLEEGRLFFSSFSPPASFRLSAGPRSRKAIVKDAFSIRPLVWPPRKTYHVRQPRQPIAVSSIVAMRLYAAAAAAAPAAPLGRRARWYSPRGNLSIFSHLFCWYTRGNFAKRFEIRIFEFFGISSFNSFFVIRCFA